MTGGIQKAGERYHKVSKLTAIVKVYSPAIERDPMLQARALGEPLRTLDRNKKHDQC